MGEDYNFEKDRKYSDILFFPYDEGRSFEKLAEDREGFLELATIGSNWDVPACNHWEGIPA